MCFAAGLTVVMKGAGCRLSLINNTYFQFVFVFGRHQLQRLPVRGGHLSHLPGSEAVVMFARQRNRRTYRGRERLAKFLGGPKRWNKELSVQKSLVLFEQTIR